MELLIWTAFNVKSRPGGPMALPPPDKTGYYALSFRWGGGLGGVHKIS